MQIERAFWTAHDVTFKVVTEKSMDLVKAKNIEKVLGYYDLTGIADEAETAEISAVLLHQMMSNPYQTLLEDTTRALYVSGRLVVVIFLVKKDMLPYEILYGDLREEVEERRAKARSDDPVAFVWEFSEA